ncbi:MAG TPA: GntR family transcriptional regulator [Burkholderiaceae bacterium]|nr:GntR family transcriptional regulator [Burkholderiaceae bacterium]
MRSSADAAPSTLASSLAAKLRGAITRGEIAPGTKLHLEDLRATFGVSLSPLREALSRLSAEGFVVTEDQRGYRVAPISEANLREVMRLRCQFESFALRESIANGTIDWEGQVVAALYRLNKLDSSAEQRPRVEAWENEHRIFHATLIGACQMPLLLHFCATLHDLSDRYRRLFLEHHAIDRSVADEHEQIAEATIRRDADRAVELLAQHVERTGQNVLSCLPKT